MEIEIVECPCKRISCENHGNCKACREHHALKKNSSTACEKIKLKEERRKSREERSARHRIK